jgi:hypothetical protein
MPYWQAKLKLNNQVNAFDNSAHAVDFAISLTNGIGTDD